jgi:hypothetical protein
MSSRKRQGDSIAFLEALEAGDYMISRVTCSMSASSSFRNLRLVFAAVEFIKLALLALLTLLHNFFSRPSGSVIDDVLGGIHILHLGLVLLCRLQLAL